MPELPEVETIVRNIRPSLVGRRIGKVMLSHDDVLRGVTRRSLVRRLKGSKIRSVTRRAKHAVLELDTARLVIQPGMTGSLMVQRALEPEEAKYAVLRAELSRGQELVYRDVRRLGTLLLLNAKQWAAYGPPLQAGPLARSRSARQGAGADLGHSVRGSTRERCRRPR